VRVAVRSLGALAWMPYPVVIAAVDSSERKRRRCGGGGSQLIGSLKGGRTRD
jgi:hypothetical protein